MGQEAVADRWLLSHLQWCMTLDVVDDLFTLPIPAGIAFLTQAQLSDTVQVADLGSD